MATGGDAARGDGSELHRALLQWKEWARSADQREDGWQSSFPDWSTLVALAAGAMATADPDEGTLADLTAVWAASEEGEELLGLARAHADQWVATLTLLSGSTLPAVRWQAYEAAAEAGSQAEALLRRGLADPDAYARRRAILALARRRPHDAQTLAEALMRDPDPYVRQAAIELILAASDASFQARALRLLAEDPVEHVREAARRRSG